jgi:hypothetical protein
MRTTRFAIGSFIEANVFGGRVTVKQTKEIRDVGFWYSEGERTLPKPLPQKKPTSDAFLMRLKILTIIGKQMTDTNVTSIAQDNSIELYCTSYCGYSTCRLCKQTNGVREFRLISHVHNLTYRFPEGLLHYYECHKVHPTDDFYAFIMGISEDVFYHLVKFRVIQEHLAEYFTALEEKKRMSASASASACASASASASASDEAVDEAVDEADAESEEKPAHFSFASMLKKDLRGTSASGKPVQKIQVVVSQKIKPTVSKPVECFVPKSTFEFEKTVLGFVQEYEHRLNNLREFLEKKHLTKKVSKVLHL